MSDFPAHHHGAASRRDTDRIEDPSPLQSKALRVTHRGISVPWGWVFALAPSFGLVGAIGHSAVFGAPPEFTARLDEHQRVLVELHERDALKEQRMQQISDTLRRIETQIESINSRLK